MNWLDFGYKLGISVSTDGDIVGLGTRTDYPFTANGSAAAPLGWTLSLTNGASITDVNWTTQDGRWSVSNGSTANTNADKWYGIYRDFPVVPNRRYVFQFQARTMQDRSSALRLLRWQVNGTGPQTGAHSRAYDDWEQVAMPITALSGWTFLRIFLIVNPHWDDITKAQADWGVQFQNFAVIDQDPTYPDPTFRDVSCDIQSFMVRYGRARYTGRYDVAGASIGIINNDGEWIYDPNHPWGLRPGRFVKVDITPPGSQTKYPMYYGLIDKIQDAFTIDGRSFASLECVDVSSLLSNWNVATAGSDTESFQPGVRIRRLASSVGWLPQNLSLQDGPWYQQTINANGRTVRDEMGLCADSEGGYFYCDRTGKLTYFDRNAPTTVRTWNTVQAELLAMCVPPTGLIDGFINGSTWLQTPDAPNLTPVPPVEFRWKMRADDWEVSYKSVIYQSTTNQQSFVFYMQNGQIALSASENGVDSRYSTFLSAAELAPLLPLDGRDVIIVARIRPLNTWFETQGSISVDNGKTWLTAPWRSTVAQLTKFFDSNQAMGIGQGFAGRIYWAEMRNGIAPAVQTVVWRFDANEYPGTGTTFTDPRGRVWNMGAATAITPKQPTGGLPPVDAVPEEPDKAIVFVQSLETDWDRSRVINDVQIANQGGTAFQLTDDVSKRKYGPRTYQRLDFVNANSRPDYTQQRLHDYLDRWTEAVLRVNRVSWRPALNDPASALWAIKAFLNDVVRVRYEHPTQRWGYSVATHIQSIQHTFTKSAWEVVVELDQPLATFQWEFANTGYGWDEAKWDVNKWDESGFN
jgi:hypothetical protein